MSIAERLPANKLLISALSVFLVFVLCVAYTISNVLDTPLTSRPRNVKVELSATGGLFEGSVVTYRGVNIGKVTSITFTPTGVEANARITSSDKIPASSHAQVRSLSPVGEQYLDFQPANLTGPYLKDGSRISAQYTDIPRTLASTVISVNKLLNQVDAKKLHTVLAESSAALQGTSDDLTRLTDQGQLLVQELDRLWPQTERVLTNGGTLLDIGVDNQDTLARTAKNFRLFAAFLKAYDPELRSLFKKGPAQLTELRGLLDDAKATLPAFLRLGGDVMGIIASYEPHLRVLLANFGPGLGVLGKAVKNNVLQLNAIGQPDHLCEYDTARRDPKNPQRRTLITNQACPSGHAYLQRGAAHAPGPVR